MHPCISACTNLRDAGVGYGEYPGQLTYRILKV